MSPRGFIRRSAIPLVLAVGAIRPPAAGAQATPVPGERGAPFVERVEVRVRSILVSAADAKGHPPDPPLGPADLEVFENGKPVEVIGVEPVRPPAPPRNPAAPPVAPADTRETPHASGTPQYLYLDTTALNRRSMKLVTDAVASHLEGILALGPLEIVLADATPRVDLPSTSDASALRRELARIGSEVPGKERLLDLRRDALREVRDAQNSSTNAAADSVRAHVQAAVTHELALLRIAFHRLEAWAAARSETRAGILYYATDGFDMDPVETYERSITSTNPALRQEALQMEAEYGGEVPKMLAEVESTLAGKGLTTIPIALGGTSAEFASSAGNMGLRGAQAMRQVVDFAPLFFYQRPTDPLRLVADATGGEVVTTSSHFGSALDHLESAYLVTFRVAAIPDGRPHPLVVRSRRPGVTVRASRHLLTGTPRAVSADRAVRVLDGSEKPADLPVVATLAAGGPAPAGKRGGTLRIVVNFSSVEEALGIRAGGPVSLRLSLAVEIAGGEPFTSSEDVEWTPDSSSWRYQIPMTWPDEARRIAVLVEELSAGLSGATIVDVPAPR